MAVGPDPADGLSRSQLSVTPLAHVTTAFSEYAGSTGNALATKIYQHARAHEKAGGTAYVIASGRRHHDYPAGTVVRYGSAGRRREWFTDTERRVDAALGRIIGRRPMAERLYRPALDAVPPDTQAVVVYNQPSLAGASTLRRFDGVRVLHLGNDVFSHWSRREILRALDRFDLTVVVSEFIRASIVRRLGSEHPRLQVLLNGIDLEDFHPYQGATPTVPTVLFLGNLVPRKGAHHLVHAALALQSRGLDFRVVIVGSPGLRSATGLTDYERHLRDIAAPLGEAITFRPFAERSTVPDLYRKASIFCMPVEWEEPAGQVVTEAMASGLPVVSAPRGGIPEYLGPDGVYCDPQDTTALADRLADLITDPDGAHRVGERLRSRAEQMSWERRMWQFDLLLGGVAADR